MIYNGNELQTHLLRGKQFVLFVGDVQNM